MDPAFLLSENIRRVLFIFRQRIDLDFGFFLKKKKPKWRITSEMENVFAS